MSNANNSTFPIKELLEFTIERGEASATASLELSERHMNPNAVVRGSVAFALMDTARGAAAMAVVPEGSMSTTIEIPTRFHRAAQSGSLTAEATILAAGRRIVHLQARTVDSDDRLVASATGSFAVIARAKK